LQNYQPHRHPYFVVRFWAVQPCPHQRCPGLKAKSEVTGQTSNRLQDIRAQGGGSWFPLASNPISRSCANPRLGSVQVDDNQPSESVSSARVPALLAHPSQGSAHWWFLLQRELPFPWPPLCGCLHVLAQKEEYFNIF